MHDNQVLTEVLAAAEQRRHHRRAFLRTAGAAAATAGVAGLLASCKDDNNNAYQPTPFPTPTPTVSDADVLNFALNLEYLEAQFYSFAATGAGLPNSQLSGTGTQGTVTGGKLVAFSDQTVAQYAREIAADEAAHVAFLRSALGSSAVAMPSINIDGGASGAFTAAARAAGVVGSTGTFDPYASDENFLLGAFIFEDVGVTAYKGSIASINNKTYVEAAAGIHAAEAYHAGLVRTLLYAKGLQTPTLRTAAGQISDARDSLDGSTDLDQGIVGDSTTSNIVPTDSNGICFSRTPGQVLNIVYLTASSTTSGGFFPSGVNGTVRQSSGV
ncbi:ferritin-like domain-containing protein [Sphingomonas sp. XXL09]|uniref:ferritin-like domain-containing protein n=1 Tax=Sphingomonas sp. XXL09 TaxID=3457787 RepID=UPI00406BA813